MKQQKKYNGVVVPMVTPLTPNHELDAEAALQLMASIDACNCSVFLMGTTGEAPSLSGSLRKNFFSLAASVKRSGALFAGISSLCVEDSIDLSYRAAEAGVDVVVVTIPSYYSLSEFETCSYLECIADKSPVPVMVYNIPATTHLSIPLEWLDKLSQHPNLVGLKDSERSDERLEQSLALWKDRQDFSHFVGWAARSARALELGSDGIIPSTGNITPEIYQRMMLAYEAGDLDTMYDCQRLSDEIGAVYQSGRSLGASLWALKVLLQDKGIGTAHVMPPLQNGSTEEAEKIINHFTKIYKA
jgi:4-hydroxy-tetrahydrodipicolinate synthase